MNKSDLLITTATDNPLVGINYFAGWWRETPNKWQDCRDSNQIAADWRGKYPERVPMYGCFIDQPTVDSDIINASAYGGDYFQILWYPAACGIKSNEPHAERLNDGLRFFMNSKQNDRMKFTVEFCNHPPFSLESREMWDEAVGIWCEAFSHPSYLKPRGKALFKIHGHDYFIRQCGGLPEAGRKLEELRTSVHDRAGLEMLITTGITAGDIPERMKNEMDGIDFFSTYMDVPPDEPAAADYPYERLFDFTAKMAEGFGGAGIPYQPYLPVGWNPKPTYDPRPGYSLPTKTQITESAKKLMEIIDKYDCLGVSEKGKNRTESFTVYSWNEFGEGGFLAPTIIGGFDKLEGLRDALAFSRETPAKSAPKRG